MGMNLYAWSAPGTGVNADELRNEEVWKGYFESGLNVMNLTGKNGYDGKGWEKSTTKKCFDIAEKLGVKKIMLDDMRIYELVEYKDKLIGNDPDCRFSSESEMDDFVEECMKDYIYHPCFYGLRLRDEPIYSHLKAYGESYRSIMRVAKKLGKDYVHINMNLLPMDGVVCRLCPELSHLNATGIYTRYIEDYIKVTGTKWLSVDNYPYHLSDNGGRFYEGYYSTFQITKRVCDKYGVNFVFAVASFEMESPDGKGLAGYRRITDVNEMFLQVNSALGFGAREITFYTYVTMLNNSASYLSRDGSSFINGDGTKTWVYNYSKEVIEHIKKLEKVVFEYDWKGAKIYLHKSAKAVNVPHIKDLPENLANVEASYLSSWPIPNNNGGYTTADFDNSYEFKKIKNIEYDKDILLVSHFEKQGENPNMYMFENIIDRCYKTNPSSMKLKVDFGINVKKLHVLKDKDFEVVELNNGIFNTDLSRGEAVWVIPVE